MHKADLGGLGGYPVYEMFTGVQFEGNRSGSLNFFIRLAGCNLSCPFCDTDPASYDVHWFRADTLRRAAEVSGAKRVILTGGEPTIHDLGPLLSELDPGFFIAMETNGINLKRLDIEKWWEKINWVTVSPKTRIDDGILLDLAAEVKYVIPDFESFVLWKHPRVYLQPEWNNPKALSRCIDLLAEHPNARLSVQTHKYLGLK